MEDIKGKASLCVSNTKRADHFALGAGIRRYGDLLEPVNMAIVCLSGAFGGCMAETVRRREARAIDIEQSWGEAVDSDIVEDAFKQSPEATVLTFVHAGHQPVPVNAMYGLHEALIMLLDKGIVTS